MHPTISLASGLCRDRDTLIRREWLVTNGLGGYAMGTVAGVLSRSYHGYLIAATTPPVGRTLLLQQLTEVVHVGWKRFVLGDDEWIDTDAPPPNAPALIESFALDGTLPVWVFAFEGVRIEKRLWMAHGQNTVYVRYTLLDAPQPVPLEVIVGVNDRDHHATSVVDDRGWRCDITQNAINVRRNQSDATRWALVADPPTPLTIQGAWSDALYLRTEAERGLVDREQRYTLGRFAIPLTVGLSWTLIATTEDVAQVERDPAAALAAEQSRQQQLIAQAGAEAAAATTQQLILAADQFIVARTGSQESSTDNLQSNQTSNIDHPTSVIAGYPWFGDWGRDTMISLPGLCLSTGRFNEAANILRTFARYVSRGMLPNRFPDVGDEPEYNTVDAALWYFWAIDRYHAATDDDVLLAELEPTLADIIDWHGRGTRYGIAVDPRDGLLQAGEPGAQLTWMDVRIDEATLLEQQPHMLDDPRLVGEAGRRGLVVTPRHGKAVEINALWWNALRLMARWTGDRDRGAAYAELAKHVKASFGRFWYAEGGYLYDVIDGPHGDDATLRPNQVLAMSVAADLLTHEQRRSAIETVNAHLWTPYGLRTLDPRDPAYQPRFMGNRFARDYAYHQGTVWPWLLGHYLDARRSVDPDLDVQPFLQPLIDHLREGGLGTVPEVFDADPPRSGGGCPAQAWSIAELLRIGKV